MILIFKKRKDVLLSNPIEEQILPTAINLLHAEVMIATQLRKESICEIIGSPCNDTTPVPSSYMPSQPSDYSSASDNKSDP